MERKDQPANLTVEDGTRRNEELKMECRVRNRLRLQAAELHVERAKEVGAKRWTKERIGYTTRGKKSVRLNWE